MRNDIGKTIGIIGAGAIGTAFAKALARHGIEAVIANSRASPIACRTNAASASARVSE